MKKLSKIYTILYVYRNYNYSLTYVTFFSIFFIIYFTERVFLTFCN